jgi:hypothetical protein
MASDWVHVDTAWDMSRDLQRSLERMTEERDRWRKTAEVLAGQLGKVEYAQAEYENQGDL